MPTLIRKVLSMVASRSETYVVSNIGSCLILKLCGFVHELQAEIYDVSENHLRLRVGSSWLAQLIGSGRPGHPMDVDIQFAPLQGEEDSRRPQARVEIVIRDRSGFLQAGRFEPATQNLLWQLRSHLMV